MNRKYGVIGSRPYRPEPRYAMAAPTMVDHVDRLSLWRTIRDQGQEGCCTGCGTSGAIETALNIRESLSIQFPYFNARVLEATQDSDAGAMVSDALAGIMDYGICTERAYPYVVGSFSARPTVDAYADAMNIKGKIGIPRRIEGSEQLKSALAAGHPVVFGFSVPAYFEGDAVAAGALVRVPTDTDRILGGHCVYADGFDARGAEPFVWCPNSWGKDWGGYGGWFKLAMSWFDDPRRLVDEAYCITPA